ncbi:MAG TPA: helix-turn-helix transcriptional regulator [Acidimicrobiia bacterium]|nr:helix-turn-helix transcriptional regulator [Acidimicrobiia bacterium]
MIRFMSVRNGLLALLAEEPRHCYALKSDFESRTGGAWSVNIGQVYSTLERLERDGLIAPIGDDAAAGRSYRLTRLGRVELEEWFSAPVLVDPPPRDEMAIKLLLAVGAPDVDVAALIQQQRLALVRILQRYTRQKELLDEDSELPTVLLHDALILNVEAQLRWLDLCEARVGRQKVRREGTSQGANA